MPRSRSIALAFLYVVSVAMAARLGNKRHEHPTLEQTEADEAEFAAQAHWLRTEINTVAVLVWFACLAAVVVPSVWPRQGKDAAEQEKSVSASSAWRTASRVVGGISLAVVSFVYLFSYGPVRHAVMSQSVVQSFLMPYFNQHDAWILRKIENALPPQGRILNFGAGGNTFSDLLVSHGYDVVPLDIVDESIAKTPVTTYDGMQIPDSLGQFDAAIIITVLHHIEDQFIPHIFDDLAKHAKRIVVLEDVASHQAFVDRALNCVKLNMELFNHPLNFRSHEAWKERFGKYNVVNATTDGFASLFVLEP